MSTSSRRGSPVCAAEGCIHFTTSRYCSTHARRLARYGSAEASVPPRPMRVCDVDGCGQKHYGLGFCREHYVQLKRSVSKWRA